METTKKMISAETFMNVYAFHFLQMGRSKIKEILKNTKKNFQIYFVQPALDRFILLHWRGRS